MRHWLIQQSNQIQLNHPVMTRMQKSKNFQQTSLCSFSSISIIDNQFQILKINQLRKKCVIYHLLDIRKVQHRLPHHQRRSEPNLPKLGQHPSSMKNIRLMVINNDLIRTFLQSTVDSCCHIYRLQVLYRLCYLF